MGRSVRADVCGGVCITCKWSILGSPDILGAMDRRIAAAITVSTVLVAAGMVSTGCRSDDEASLATARPGSGTDVRILEPDDLGDQWVVESQRELPAEVATIEPPCDAPPYDDGLTVTAVEEVQLADEATSVGISHTVATVTSGAGILATWRDVDCAGEGFDQQVPDLADLSDDSTAFEVSLGADEPTQIVIITERGATLSMLIVTGPAQGALQWARQLTDQLSL